MNRYLLVLFLTFFVNACSAQKTKSKGEKYFNEAQVEYAKGSPLKALKLLSKAIKKDPKFVNAWSLQAEIAERVNDSGLACRSYRKAISLDPLYQANYFYYANYLFKLDRYDEAETQLELFFSIASNVKFNPRKDGASDNAIKEAGKLQKSCKLAKADMQTINGLKIENMGKAINSTSHEYWPGMTIDGKYFVYTRNVGGQEDFYIASRSDSGWIKSIPLPGSINTPDNEGTTSVTPDGKYIFFTVCNQDGYGSCDLYYSVYNASNNTWSKRRNLGPTVNSAAWDAQPAIGADAKTLIFSSARPGGYGGKDLWQTVFANGRWAEPINLGAIINTSEDEEAPFLHYDGKTLYLSSNGHPGFGANDLFISKKDSSGKWLAPVNLGKGINTGAQEAGLYVEYKGVIGYFSSSRAGGLGGLDIYSFNLSPDKRPGPISYVTGIVIDENTGVEISGRIEIIDLKNNQKQLNDSSSTFFTTLEPGGNYALNVYRKGYLFYSANFQPELASIDSPFVVVAKLKAIKENEKVVLRNIFFDVDKFEIKPESFSELDAVVKLLMNNPDMKIEIGGHTDNSGSEEHNKELSLNRAKSVLNYLVQKGIKNNRISAKGYASASPIAGNDSEEGRALNRRIEMRVTSN